MIHVDAQNVRLQSRVPLMECNERQWCMLKPTLVVSHVGDESRGR